MSLHFKYVNCRYECTATAVADVGSAAMGRTSELDATACWLTVELALVVR